jgi:hypothetical protein
MNAPIKFDDPTTLRWWAAALKGQRGPINSNEPMTGYYRARNKNRQTNEETLYAVAYWWHNGKCFCRSNPPGTIGAAPTLTGDKHERMMASWPYVSKEPIEFDVYQSVLAGKPWPDQHVAPKAAPAETSDGLPHDAERQGTPPPAAGAVPPPAERTTEVDNSPQAVLRREIEAARAGITNYVKRDPDGKASSLIDSDAMASAAQSLRSQLLTFSNKAKKAREDANRPHNDAIKANGQIWTPLEFLAKSTADDLRDGPIKAWEVHKREQAASAARAAQAATAASGTPVAPVSNAPAPSAKIKGATGKAASVQEIKIAVIHDQDQVYAHFRNNEQVKAILQGLANAAVRAGIEVPGVTVTEDVSIR